jgi:hypothetical protein
VRQAGANSFTQHFALELGENGEHACHCPPGWCAEIQALGDASKADSGLRAAPPDSE